MKEEEFEIIRKASVQLKFKKGEIGCKRPETTGRCKPVFQGNQYIFHYST